MTRVSVVVPTYQRPDLLDRCIAALIGQSIAPRDYEIIIGDDAASAVTRAQVEQWRVRSATDIRYAAVSDGPRGPAAARNAGWRVARGGLIAFTDDDTIPAADWLERALAAFQDKSVAAASGRVVVPLPPTPTDYERDAAGLENAGFVTANCFVRRNVLEAVGGFDEEYAIAWREDSDLYFRLLEGGWNVEHVADAVVVHPVRPASWGVSVKQQYKAAYDALLYKKNPTFYTRHVRPGRPSIYYLTVLALITMLAGAASGRRPVAIAGAIAWLLLTAWFAARRLHGTSHEPSHVAEMLVTSALIPPLSLFWRASGAVRFRVWFW
jgi:GT2 family glycosyltransferase